MAFNIPSLSVEACSFFTQTIRDWIDLPDSLFSNAEMSYNCVSKFASLVRSNPPPLRTPAPGEILSFGVSTVNYKDSNENLGRFRDLANLLWGNCGLWTVKGIVSRFTAYQVYTNLQTHG